MYTEYTVDFVYVVAGLVFNAYNTLYIISLSLYICIYIYIVFSASIVYSAHIAHIAVRILACSIPCIQCLRHVQRIYIYIYIGV